MSGLMIGSGIPLWIIGGQDVAIEPSIAISPGGGAHGGLRFSF